MQRANAHKIRVLIVDDHSIVRKGIRALIERQPDMSVCGEGDSVSDALEKVAGLRPDVVTVDLNLGRESGLELIRQMHALGCRVKILAMSLHEESSYLEKATAAGAHGYVKKRLAVQTLVRAIRAVTPHQLRAILPDDCAVASA